MRRTLSSAILALFAAHVVSAAGSAGGAPDWRGICRRALAGRLGAVVVVELPSGRLLHTHGGFLVRKRFEGSSIFKPLAAYALLKGGAVTPATKYASRKSIPVDRYGVALDAPYDAEGAELDLAHALSASNNGYFYTFGQKVGMETWLSTYRQMGLGSCVRAPETPREKAEFPAHGGACVRTSTVELAPYLKHLALDSGPEMGFVRDAMRLAVEEGTAKPAAVPGVAICGKTGWLRGAGRFLGFAPQGAPELGVVVTLPGATGGDAAAVAGAVFAVHFGGGGVR